MLKQLLASIFFFGRTNAVEFEYRVFSPYVDSEKLFYKLNYYTRPYIWDIDPNTKTLYYNDVNINGTKQKNTIGLKYDQLRPIKNGLFYNLDGVTSNTTYGYYSSDVNLNSVKGGSENTYSTVIASKDYLRSMPMVESGEFMGIVTESGGTPWPVDQGFFNHNDIPELSHLPENRFSSQISFGLVNDKGICATKLTDNPYLVDIVCTGEESVVNGWRLKNQSVRYIFKDYGAYTLCATKDHFFAIRGWDEGYIEKGVSEGRVFWLSSQDELPSQFESIGFIRIFCTDNMFAAAQEYRNDTDGSFNVALHIVDLRNSSQVRTVYGVNPFQSESNKNSLFVALTNRYKYETTYVVISSLDDVDRPYVFEVPRYLGVGKGGFFPTSRSYATYNGSHFEAFYPGAIPDSILVENVTNVVSCMDGIYMYEVSNATEKKWYVYTHGPNRNNMQRLLDTRLLHDWFTNDGHGCMLVKMSDKVNMEYKGHYVDQPSDIVLLQISSITLILLTISFAIYLKYM